MYIESICGGKGVGFVIGYLLGLKGTRTHSVDCVLKETVNGTD